MVADKSKVINYLTLCNHFTGIELCDNRFQYFSCDWWQNTIFVINAQCCVNLWQNIRFWTEQNTQCDINILQIFASSYNWYISWPRPDIEYNRPLNPWNKEMCSFTNNGLFNTGESIEDNCTMSSVNCLFWGGKLNCSNNEWDDEISLFVIAILWALDTYHYIMLIEQHHRLRQYPNQFHQFCSEVVPFLKFVTRPAENIQNNTNFTLSVNFTTKRIISWRLCSCLIWIHFNEFISFVGIWTLIYSSCLFYSFLKHLPSRKIIKEQTLLKYIKQTNSEVLRVIKCNQCYSRCEWEKRDTCVLSIWQFSMKLTTSHFAFSFHRMVCVTAENGRFTYFEFRNQRRDFFLFCFIFISLNLYSIKGVFVIYVVLQH